VTLGERLQEILDSLPEEWTEARVVLTLEDATAADRAALVLASLGPGRTGSTFRLTVVRGEGPGASTNAALRALDRLDAEGIDARLSLPGSAAFQVLRREAAPARASLAASWDEAVATLPPDWSDLLVEVGLTSSDDVDRGALCLGPVNPTLRDRIPPAFRFRVARRFGYGAAPQMARRCLARLDEAGIVGNLTFLRVQSETAPVLTQGPVWREGGRVV
jgi:hypothetical protein